MAGSLHAYRHPDVTVQMLHRAQSHHDQPTVETVGTLPTAGMPIGSHGRTNDPRYHQSTSKN